MSTDTIAALQAATASLDKAATAFHSKADEIDAAVKDAKKELTDYVAGVADFVRHVDANADDTVADGSEQNPYATFAAAVNSAPSGANIIVRLKNGQSHYINEAIRIVNKRVLVISSSSQLGGDAPNKPGDDSPFLSIAANVQLLFSSLEFGRYSYGVRVNINTDSAIAGGELAYGNVAGFAALTFAHSELVIAQDGVALSVAYGIARISFRSSDVIKQSSSADCYLADISRYCCSLNVDSTSLVGTDSWSDLFYGILRSGAGDPINISANVTL